MVLLIQTSERLKRNAKKIMNCWEERALKEVAAASHQETLALRDSLPEYLSQLSDALSTTIDRNEARVKADRIDSERVGKKHGYDRAGNYPSSNLARILKVFSIRPTLQSR